MSAILLIDDDNGNHDFLLSIIDPKTEVLYFTNTKAALKCKKTPKLDLILLDNIKGENYQESCIHLRKKYPEIPILMYSFRAFTPEQARQKGATDFLDKGQSENLNKEDFITHIKLKESLRKMEIINRATGHTLSSFS